MIETKSMSIRYRHFRDNDNKLVATLCKLTNPETNEVGLGLSICSNYDNFSRKTGRELSLGRAYKAFLSKRPTLPIRMRLSCLNVIDTMCIEDLVKELKFPFKSIYREVENQ